MKIQDPFSAGILIDPKKSIFYLLYAAVYKTAKSGTMESKYLTKKQMLSKIQKKFYVDNRFISKEKLIFSLNFGYFHFFASSSTFLAACWPLIFISSQHIAKLYYGLIDLDCDFKTVHRVKGVLTNNFHHG